MDPQHHKNEVWPCISLIPGLRRWWKEDQKKFKISLGLIKPCQNKGERKKEEGFNKHGRGRKTGRSGGGREREQDRQERRESKGEIRIGEYRRTVAPFLRRRTIYEMLLLQTEHLSAGTLPEAHTSLSIAMVMNNIGFESLFFLTFNLWLLTFVYYLF